MVKKLKNSTALRMALAAGLPLMVVTVLIIVGLDTGRVARNVIEIRTDIDTSVKQTEEITRLREEAAEAREKKAVLESILPNRDELFSFSDEIEQAGSDNSVAASFDFGSEGKTQIGYNLTAGGSYGNIIEFVKYIEDEIPFMRVSSFNLVKSDGEYNIELRGDVFFNGEG